jgi:hypothetical protein
LASPAFWFAIQRYPWPWPPGFSQQSDRILQLLPDLPTDVGCEAEIHAATVADDQM